jgi:hypothetical protein
MLRAESTSPDSLPSVVVRREPQKSFYCRTSSSSSVPKNFLSKARLEPAACHDDYTRVTKIGVGDELHTIKKIFVCFFWIFLKDFFIVRVSTQCSDGWQGKPKVNSKSRANDCPDVGDHPEETKVVN